MSEEDKLTQLDANFAHVRRELVERDELARVRPLQCEFELREELLVDVASASAGSTASGRCGRRDGCGGAAGWRRSCRCHAAGARE